MWHFSPDDFLAGGSSQQLVVAGGWRIREESGNAGLFVSVDLSLTFPLELLPSCVYCPFSCHVCQHRLLLRHLFKERSIGLPVTQTLGLSGESSSYLKMIMDTFIESFWVPDMVLRVFHTLPNLFCPIAVSD